MTANSPELSYAVRMPVLAKYLGLLASMLALLTLVPLGAAVVFQDYAIALRYLAVIAVLLAAWGISRAHPEPKRIQANEALTIAALAFVLSPLLMTFPFMASGLSFTNALFEAISAITTTGLSVSTDLAAKPETFLFARAWMQWYGGLGIVVLSIAILMGSRMPGRSLTEPLGGETLATTTRKHARQALVIYGALTAAGIAVVWLISGNGAVAVNHVLAAVSTGGFSSFDDSLAGLDSWYARFAIIGISLCGALPLTLYALMASSRWRAGVQDAELLALLAAVVLVALLLFLSLRFQTGMELSDAAGHALFLAMSAQSTTGFATLDLGAMEDSAKLSMIVSMLVGGGVGSTAGGIKLLRLLILLRVIQVVLQRTTMPSHALHYARLRGKVLGDATIQRVLTLILLYVGVVAASWFAFLVHGYVPMDALFEVASATATAGLSVGITAADMPVFLKAVLCLDMLLGRLEIIALLVVLYLPNWIGTRKEA
ncbi:potassium transporter TrkG [Guyparkeria sp. 1SP6A2]|nr:potassium transporter TrkG [Guyparkeria sp. 1SP6A2]